MTAQSNTLYPSLPVKTKQLPFGEALLFVEVSDIPKGYQLCQKLLKLHLLRLIEIAPVSPGQLILVFNGNGDSISQANLTLDSNQHVPAESDSLVSGDVKKLFLEKAHPDLLYGLFHLLKTELGESLLFLQTKSICQLMELVNLILSSEDIKLMEIKTSRQLGLVNLAILTGSNLAMRKVRSKHFNQSEKKLDLSVEFLEDIPDELKNFF